MGWLQKTIQLPAFPKGCHSITRHILDALPELVHVKVGMLHLFIQHTSASLTINENADPDVLTDLDRALDAIAPEDFPYRHTCEGRDDMPAHTKATVTGPALAVPVAEGSLCLGTWQGLVLCEHRHQGGRRRLVLTLQGDFGR
ncbi:MAG: secondary thiamine-phosphate synthase enzyme YjbQ [Patescibacteria group bacterium]|nr:secondary thiamine-phosphate synthase enzyme YjbQ [Patescibacteria group bacterium]